MPEDIMSISVNGQSQVPPGFRFHPTEEELLHYYLKKKVLYEKIDLDVIRDVDLNKLEPWEIQEKCRIGTTPQNEWYFFSHKDKKYPTGTRTNRATTAGFWKATGRDKVIFGNGKRIGMRKTLVFYKGRAPHGQKSDWIMHEYRLDDNTNIHPNVSNIMGEAAQEEGWVVCRIFKKKNHQKTLGSPLCSSSIITEDEGNQVLDDHYPNEATLDNVLEYMGTPYKDEHVSNNNSSRFLLRPIETNRFMKLPSLESPNSQSCYQILTENESSMTNHDQVISCTNPYPVCPIDNGLTNWSAIDRILASHLNGDPTNINHQLLQFPDLKSSSFPLPLNSNRSYPSPQDYHISNEINELWTFTTCTNTFSTSPNPLCHVSDYNV